MNRQERLENISQVTGIDQQRIELFFQTVVKKVAQKAFNRGLVLGFVAGSILTALMFWIVG